MELLRYSSRSHLAKHNHFIHRVKKNKYLYLLFFLPFCYYIIFHYWPMYGIIIAFKDYNIVKGIIGSPWVGLEHFKKFLFDPYFWKLVRNTLLINIYGLIWSFPAPIILALLLNEVRNQKFKRFVQSVSTPFTFFNGFNTKSHQQRYNYTSTKPPNGLCDNKN
jgi:ABC-type polysaccharide transport system permease subunit